MPSTPDKRQSLLQLAISLRLAAQRLADSASHIQQAASQQRQYVAKLAELRQRVAELVELCRRLGEKGKGATPQASGRPLKVDGKAELKPLKPKAPQSPRTRLPASAFVEFSNWQEFEKFRRMPPITDEELASLDVEALLRDLEERERGA